MKNVIIGIDGGSINHILPEIKRGNLKNFKKILSKGFAANLEVTKPPVTIASFPCIFSGLDVEELGKCEFFNPGYGVFSSEFWKDKSIFSLPNIKSFVLNIPSTYPAWEINGEMVTGVLTPTISEKMVYPTQLLDEIDNNWIIDGKSIKSIFKAFQIKKRLFLRKLNENFNLLAFVIRMPDLITHYPEYTVVNTKKNIQKAYREIDKFLGLLLRRKDIDNLIIFSDHGLKRFPNQFSIKKFLENEKILFYNQHDEFFKILSVFFKLMMYINPKFFDIKYVHNKVKKRFAQQIKLKPALSNNEDSRFVQFYSNYGGIFLSKKDKVKKQLIKNHLQADKNVKKVIEYNSKYLPDLLIILRNDILFYIRGSLFTKTQFNSYNHHDKGIFFAYGKDIKHGRKRVISYLDIVPTLLKLYGIDGTREYKGKALDIFNGTIQS